MLERLTIHLSQPERKALETFAAAELRVMRDQARLILRQELEWRGLLVVETQNDTGFTSVESRPRKRKRSCKIENLQVLITRKRG